MSHSMAIAFNEETIPSLSGINNPGMISGEEEKLYYYLACKHFDPNLLNLEIGTWLGRSTQRICQGFKTRTSHNFKLFCYDSYQWSESYAKRAVKQGEKYNRRLDPVKNLQPNQSFREAFLDYMGCFAPYIDAYSGKLGDISTVLADALVGKPLGLVFIDASKGWPENAALLKFIAPKLTHKGLASIMLFQDFFYFPAYKLIFILSMIPQLRPIIYTKTSTAIVYEVTDKIDPKTPILQPGSIKSLSEDDIYEAWRNLNCYIPNSRINLLATNLALPLMLWERNFKSAAKQEFEKIKLSESENNFAKTKVIANKYLSNIKPLVDLIK